MLKLFAAKEKLRQQQQQQQQDGQGPTKPKLSAGEMRLQKDMADLSLPPCMSIEFVDSKEKLTHFRITIRPEEGIYRGGKFVFDFQVPITYPHDAPKVQCLTKVFHPNIDLDGKVCLNILREDWKPVLSISSVIFGLNFLFLDPNPTDPLNKEAAQLLSQNPRQFEVQVQRGIRSGIQVAGEYFPPCHA